MEGMGIGITDLVSLLGTAADEEESGYVARSGGAPGDNPSTVIRSGAALQPAPAPKAKPAAAIWDEQEVVEGAELDDIDDPRPQPEYTINFRQTVTSEDVFLQIGNKTPATASCDLLVVRVRLPGETLSSAVVDVQTRHLDVRAQRWRLSLFLPHPVREKQGRARWEAATETLELELPVSRELDALNF